MVRQLNFHRVFKGCSVQTFFQEFFHSPAFTIGLHERLGDEGIDVSDWISTGDDSAQRLLFYSKKDEAEGGRATRVIETQSYKMLDNGSFQIKILVNPENPLGQVFRIEANWSARRHPDLDDEDEDNVITACSVDICLEIECKKRLWGGYGNSLVEGFLEKSALKEYTEWLDAAEAQISASRENVFENDDNVAISISSSSSPPSSAASAKSTLFDRHAVRATVSSVGHTVVRGTERFVSALLEHGGGSGNDERPVIHIPVSGSHLFPISSSPGHYPRYRPFYKRPLIMLALFLIILAVVLLAHPMVIDLDD